MTRKKARVKIPRKPDQLIQLGEDIIEEHTDQGANSPLNGLDMVAFAARVAAAKTKNQEQKQLRRDAETATEDRDDLLGKKKGQSSTTPGTVLNFVVRARDILLGVNKGNEQHLGDFGFEVDQSSSGSSNGSGGGTTPPTATGTVGGTAKDSVTQMGIEGVNVQVVGTGLSATTNASGIFSIANVPIGSNVVRFTKAGYATQEVQVSVTADGVTVVNVMLVPEA